MSDTPTGSKDPTAPALPDADRLPNAPYHPVLAGQPALVTGANSGIGRAVALGLARAGADVVVNYVTHPETAEEVVHEITAMGRRAIALKADVSKEDEVEADVRRRHQAVRHPAHRRQQRRPAARLRLRHHDARAMEHGDRRQPHRPVPMLPRRHPRVQAPRRRQIRLAGRRQDRLHELGAPGDPLGRPRQLRGLQGRHRHAHARPSRRSSRPTSSASTASPPAPSARRSTPPPGTRRKPMPT